MKKKFSFPINYKEILENMEYWVKWFERHSYYINEVYLTPIHLGIDFEDMNGQRLDVDKDKVNYLLSKIKQSGIKVCLIFNNIFEVGDEHLARFVEVMTLEEIIVDIVVVPNKGWIEPMKALGLEVKNTVINLPNADTLDMYSDYDLIYIHDEIIHNHDIYKKIKENKGYRLGTVVNFGDCVTFCKYKSKHYKLLSKNMYEQNSGFCATKKFDVDELLLKRNNIPGYLSEYEYYADIIDIYKLQGRSDTGTFVSAKEIVEGIATGNKILTTEYKGLLNRISPIEIDKWKIYKRNCTGECLDCEYCDVILHNMQKKEGL